MNTYNITVYIDLPSIKAGSLEEAFWLARKYVEQRTYPQLSVITLHDCDTQEECVLP